MKIINNIFYENQWKKSLSKKFFSRKSLINKKKFFYPEVNRDDIQRVILSAKSGLKINKEINLPERQKFIYQI